MTTFLADPCQLYCSDANETLIVPWGDYAADGTPCNVVSRDICISGICRVLTLLYSIKFSSQFEVSRKWVATGWWTQQQKRMNVVYVKETEPNATSNKGNTSNRVTMLNMEK